MRTASVDACWHEQRDEAIFGTSTSDGTTHRMGMSVSVEGLVHVLSLDKLGGSKYDGGAYGDDVVHGMELLSVQCSARLASDQAEQHAHVRICRVSATRLLTNHSEALPLVPMGSFACTYTASYGAISPLITAATGSGNELVCTVVSDIRWYSTLAFQFATHTVQPCWCVYVCHHGIW